jgi:hypothetical protein
MVTSWLSCEPHCVCSRQRSSAPRTPRLRAVAAWRTRLQVRNISQLLYRMPLSADRTPHHGGASHRSPAMRRGMPRGRSPVAPMAATWALLCIFVAPHVSSATPAPPEKSLSGTNHVEKRGVGDYERKDGLSDFAVFVQLFHMEDCVRRGKHCTARTAVVNRGQRRRLPRCNTFVSAGKERLMREGA